MIVSPPEQWYDVRRFMVQGGYDQFFERPGWHLRGSNNRWLLAAIKHMKSKPSHVCSALSMTHLLIRQIVLLVGLA